MFMNENIVCWDCGNRYAPKLNALRDLAQSAEGYLKYLPIEKENVSNEQPEMRANDNKEGWLTCPNCKKRFSTRDKNRWNGKMHLTCGQRIKIERVNAD